jgi:hypothetical protein
MHQARKYDANVALEYAGREEEIDKLEDEIIENYSNAKSLRFPGVPDPIACQEIFASSISMLGRITEIWNGSLKNLSKLKATRSTIMDALLPLISGGSADAREAKARSCTETINRIITLEEGLIQICESSQKNIKSAQEMASRTLKSIEYDLVYFNGAEALKNIIDANRGLKSDYGVNQVKEMMKNNA